MTDSGTDYGSGPDSNLGSRAAAVQMHTTLRGCLRRLSEGDDSAREEILEVCNHRLRELSSRLLGRFAKVRRWDNTDDVAQNAALRLYRALGESVPDSPRGLMGLMATQIQRELVDLARKHSGPMSYAANHGTNVRDATDGDVFIVDEVPDGGDGAEQEVPLDRWEAFHAAVEALPEEHREVFRLVWYLGADRETAATTLGLSIRTVGRRWQEARQMVTAAMAEEPS
jgi:RNA polymerase sigma factor (sigma-70 family)